MKAIIHARIVFPDHVMPNGVILTDGDKILDFGREKDIKIPENAQVIDAKGAFVGPGLIDIHTHAGGNVLFKDDAVFAADALLKRGVTSILPTPDYSQTPASFLDTVIKVKEAYENGKMPNFAGFYMEGPYLNPSLGSGQDARPWGDVPKPCDYMPLIEAAGDLIKVWAFSPELAGIDEFVKEVKRLIPSCVLACAHSAATPEEVEKYIPLGLKIGTHHTNATGTRFHHNGCRGVCVDEAVNYNREIYAELICDKTGVHITPYMQRLIRRIKGDDRIILISDQYVDFGPTPPGFEDATDINFDNLGEISGSALSLDLACQNVLYHMGCSVCDAFRFASTNPARALGMWDRGEIAKGNLADLVFVDPFFAVEKVIFRGEEIQK